MRWESVVAAGLTACVLVCLVAVGVIRKSSMRMDDIARAHRRAARDVYRWKETAVVVVVDPGSQVCLLSAVCALLLTCPPRVPCS